MQLGGHPTFIGDDQRVRHAGGGTVYYGGRDVSPANHTGSLNEGESITGGRWFMADTSAQVSLYNLSQGLSPDARAWIAQLVGGGSTGPEGPGGPPGPKGDQGDQGPVGERGEIGPTGVQGPQGPQGDTGAQGETGPQGPQGQQGAQGQQGQKGDTGDTGPAGTTDWAGITNKPSTFAPSTHSHAQSDVTGLVTALSGKSDTSHTHAYSSLTSIPSSFTPSAHTHTASQVTDFNSAGDARWAQIASGDQYVKRTSDLAASTSTTLADTTGLSFSVSSGTLYRFEARIVYRSAATTTGLKLGATIPAATVYSASASIPTAADGASAMWHGWLTSSGDAVTGSGVQAANTDYVALVWGILQPSANGTFQLQHASEVAGSGVTVRAGSHLSYRAL